MTKMLLPAPLQPPVLTDEDRANLAEMDAAAEECMRQWIEEHGEPVFPEPPADYSYEEDDHSMEEFYRVKDNFRELGRILDANDIAACVMTRNQIFWFIDSPANDNGHDWIMSNRFFWPDFETGTAISRADALALVGEASRKVICQDNEELEAAA